MLMVDLILVYAVIGVLVALGFLLRGVGKVDPAAKGSSVLFRVVIFPGCVGLWPVVLNKWIRAERGRGV